MEYGDDRRGGFDSNRAIVTQARAMLKQRLAKCREEEALAATLPIGSQRRDILQRAAMVERESLKEQIQHFESRIVPSFNQYARELGCESHAVGRSG